MTVRKSTKHPKGFDFTKVPAVDKLRINKNGKEKKVASQLTELVKFVKDKKMTKISREDYYNAINVINTEKDAKVRAAFKEKYPSLEKSVQTIQAVSNYYWCNGYMKQIGVAPLEA
tara:strand:- start:1773 stop:2120 length:348 start_codon:yes stop_codon:yes gene_type:complete